uniref:Uncharacterized protein n=1 Tax=Chromera velia CCMP2878 TaxID=1169474 RepID=A0A0G4I331_9ALVE|eukprot:Cvel_10498.t1-p1 / transcript=Cvel_10498.t1 / gene=Cvel_10498 / organism=Chromera_velia_CCMP2878 / gene_product=hypothetical protein / transcript_product=hypothetical protein / location=Cvel_scaffold634:62575-64590(+) / protein_length=672 / sequence_SO=supercontig / SO=protein_coding / is_pseudo=false
MRDSVPFVLQVLRHPLAGPLLLDLLCSEASAVVLSVCKDFKQRLLSLRPTCRRVTKISEEILHPLNLRLVLWIFDLPEVPQTEAVLRASAAVAGDPEVFNSLAASVPVCTVDPLKEGGPWSEHEIRCVSNLLALCDGAVSGGKAGTFRWSMERMLRGERASAVCVSGGMHIFTGWTEQALKKGFWEVRRAVIEVMKQHTGARVIAYGAQVPSEALTSLSRFPRAELESAGLSVNMGGNLGVSQIQVQEGPVFQLWLSCLKGDLEGVTEFLSSNALPSLPEVEGIQPGIGNFFEGKEGRDVGELGASLMEAAAAGGHMAIVKRVFEKVERYFKAESANFAAMAQVLRMRSSAVLNAVALQDDHLDLFEWLCDHPSELIRSNALANPLKHSTDRVGLLKRLDSRGLSEKTGLNWGRSLENAALGDSMRADVGFLEFLDSRRASDPQPVFCFPNMYHIARSAKNWEGLRFLMTREPPCPFYSNAPSHQLPEELRDLVFDLIKTVGECPWAELPSVPATLETPLREHISGTLAAASLEAVLFPDSPFDNVEVSVLHPACWLPPKPGPNFKVFQWIVERGGEEVSASIVESFKRIRQQPGGQEEGERVVDIILQVFLFNTQMRPPFPWVQPMINALRHHGFEREKREREFYRESVLDMRSWCEGHGIELEHYNERLN